MGYSSPVDLLILFHIIEIFPIESRRLHMERSCRAESLGVSRPPQPFISLRAVCRHIQKVSFLTPDRVFKKSVYFFGGSLDISGSPDIRVDHTGSKIPGIHLRHACYLHISETIEGKMRTDPLLFSGGNIGHLRLCSAEIIPVKTAVLKDLSILQPYFSSFFFITQKFRPSGDLLPEIQHGFSRRSQDFFRFLYPLDDPKRRTEPIL